MKVIPMYELRCSVCGGRSVMSKTTEPQYVRWMCPHHGVAGSDDAPFSESGVGYVSAKYTIAEFVAAKVPDDYEPRADVSLPDQEPFEALSETRFEDFEAVVVDETSMPERADYRGVVRGTVWKNVERAKKEFKGSYD